MDSGEGIDVPLVLVALWLGTPTRARNRPPDRAGRDDLVVVYLQAALRTLRHWIWSFLSKVLDLGPVRCQRIWRHGAPPMAINLYTWARAIEDLRRVRDGEQLGRLRHEWLVPVVPGHIPRSARISASSSSTDGPVGVHAASANSRGVSDAAATRPAASTSPAARVASSFVGLLIGC